MRLRLAKWSIKVDSVHLTCIDGGLSGSDWHVGGISHQRRSLHDALNLSIHFHCQLMREKRPSVDANSSSANFWKETHLREVSQYFRHFISTLSAAHVDDDVTVRVLGQRLGNDGLPAAESSRDGGGSSLHAADHRQKGKIWLLCFWKVFRGKGGRGTHGKRASRTLCPVSSGWLAGSFSVTGRTCLTGHTCTMVNFSFTPSNSSSITTSWQERAARQHRTTAVRPQLEAVTLTLTS